MNLCSEFVKHKKFGVGTIVESTEDYIIVLFHETQEKKKFLYPDAIGDFLELQSKLSSDNKEQIMQEGENGDASEHEQKRMKDIKRAIKRELNIKKIIENRQEEEKK